MSSTEKAKAPLYFGWYVCAATVFVAFVTTGARSSFGIFIIPLEEEFGWSRFMLSSAVGTGFLVNGLTQPFVGRLFDQFSGRTVIMVGLIIAGLATASLSLTFNYLFLFFVFGILLSTAMSGASVTNTMALLAKWFHRRRSTVLGINVAGASLGGLTLVPFGMFLLQATSWRVTWAALGLIILVLALPMVYFFIRNDPADMGLQPDGDTEEATSANKLESKRGPIEVEKWSESFRSWPMWQISTAYTVCGITTGMIAAHFVPYAIGEGLSGTLAALAFGVMMALNVVGGLGAGFLGDRFGRKNLLAAVYVLRGIAFIFLLLFHGATGVWIFALLAGFSWIASVPLTTSLTADVYGLRALATISGISFLCHQVGSFVSILAAGLLFDITGSYTLPFAIGGALLFPAAISAFSVRERKYSARYQTPLSTAAAAGD
ncbi:MAG: MFS transporter [Dehalococcoidia bacterium]|nr:MFS transporter [Dehalococcoidia bacterium]